MGCYRYLTDKLAYPSKAKCIAERSVSPLKIGEDVGLGRISKVSGFLGSGWRLVLGLCAIVRLWYDTPS